MPSLAGFFGRKNKSKSRSNGHETDSAMSSPTAEYITPDRSSPSSPNGKSSLHPDSARRDHTSVYPSIATSSSKLRLPFSRKKTPASASAISVATTAYTVSQDSHSAFGTPPPRPTYLSSPRNSSSTAASDVDPESRRLRPPPSKSAIFAAYGDPSGALSTRSLPNDTTSPLSLTISTTSSNAPPPVPPKKPGFFPWSKSTPTSPQPTTRIPKISTSPPQLSPISPTPTETSINPNSFNLKSFRHVGPSPNASNSSLPPAIPRPRGTSTTSDPSQRISVAAFREAQARRSTAGSPVPSNRAPSPGPLSATATRPGQSHASSAPAVPQKEGRHTRNKRSSVLAYASDSDSDESEEDDDDQDEEDGEEEDDVDLGRNMGPRGGGLENVRRRRTLTKRSQTEPAMTFKGRATKSEVGHGSTFTARRDFTPGPRSHSGHILMSQYPGQPKEAEKMNSDQSRSQSSLGFNNNGQRPRASASTSALTPSAAAKRASVVTAANAVPLTNANGKRHSRALSAHSVPAPTPPAPSTAGSSSTHTRRPAAAAIASDSDSTDSDDAPLATLVPPRRPGSGLSSTSHSSLRSATMLPKPLIDINELTNGRPIPAKGNSTDGFTGGATTLIGRTMMGNSSGNPVRRPTSPTGGLGRVTGGAGDGPVPTSVSPPTKFVSPPSSPIREAHRLPAKESERKPVQQALRSTGGAPMRRETSPGEGQDGGGKRDILGERLTRVVQLRSGSLPMTTSPGSSSGTASGSGSVVASGSDKGTAIAKTTTTTSPAPIPAPAQTKVARSPPAPQPPTVSKRITPPEEDLASLLGANIHLIHRTGDSESESEAESEESEEGSDSEDGFSKVKVKVKAKVNDDEKEKDVGKGPEPDRIAPIPIKERAPPPAFSVTSRPPLKRPALGASGHADREEAGGGDRTSVASTILMNQGTGGRQRSVTLVNSSSISVVGSSGTGPTKATRPGGILNSGKMSPGGSTSSVLVAPRQRSSTLLPNPTSTSTSASTSTAASTASSVSGSAGGAKGTSVVAVVPSRPFAAVRRESPASSTGDSSSGRAPFTPKDGSEVGVGNREGGWSGGVSGLTVTGRHTKRRSVSFEEEAGKGKGGKEEEKIVDREERRKERRRSEAKAAIELGNVINGRGPVMDDDDDEDLPINQTLVSGGARMSTINPLMAMGGGAVGGIPMGYGPAAAAAAPGWNMSMMGSNPAMLSPAQFMPQGSADPNFMAAHQQAMMYAKQAYQMAVAQQAMAAAGDEWERGSTIGGFGSGGSVYGGTSPSIVGSPYGMSPMMNMNMNMGMGMGVGVGMGMQTPGSGWSSAGSVIFPASARSMYGGVSGSRSEYGGGGGRGGGQWGSSKSSYGESFGPSSSSNNRLNKMGVGQHGRGQRDSGYFPPVPPIPQHASGSPAKGGSSAPRARTTSQPASPGRGVRKTPPPSSWKPGGA